MNRIKKIVAVAFLIYISLSWMGFLSFHLDYVIWILTLYFAVVMAFNRKIIPVYFRNNKELIIIIALALTLILWLS